MTVKTWEGSFCAPKGRIGIVVSRFNEFVVESLLKGALDSFERHGVLLDNIEVIYVPGAYELPIACLKAAETGRFKGLVALGAVIRGTTAHFEYVAGGCTNGLSQVSLKTGVPIMFGVITTETIEQAIERAGTKAGNKGMEAAMGLLELIDVLDKIHD